MRLLCKQLRIADTWFQTGFVLLFLGCVNTACVVWPSAESSLILLMLANVFVLAFVLSNTEVWITDEKDVRLRNTILGFIPWRTRLIKKEHLQSVTAKRISDHEQWPNCIATLSWIQDNETENAGLRSVVILQRRQELGVSVSEAKRISKSLGIEFTDHTNKLVDDSIRHSDQNGHKANPS